MLGEPRVGAGFDSFRGRGVRRAKFVHAAAEAKGIERIDGEGSMAALGAAGSAGQPLAGTMGGFSQRGIHDLHEFGVTGGQGHAAKDTGCVRR